MDPTFNILPKDVFSRKDVLRTNALTAYALGTYALGTDFFRAYALETDVLRTYALGTDAVRDILRIYVVRTEEKCPRLETFPFPNVCITAFWETGTRVVEENFDCERKSILQILF